LERDSVYTVPRIREQDYDWLGIHEAYLASHGGHRARTLLQLITPSSEL
jgi:hypothetical protein